MCCSRVCSVRTQQRRPRRSTVWPAIRPGIRRTNGSRQAMMPRYGPPNSIGVPSDWPSATAMSAPRSPGRLSRPRLIGSKTCDQQRPALVRDLRRPPPRPPGSRRSSDAGPARRPSGRRPRPASSARSHRARPARRRVTSSRVQVGQVRLQDLPVFGVHAGGDDHLRLALRHAQAHQHRFRRRAAAVVQAGVGDVHAGQLADQRLVLEHRLQRALADLRLVGRVGGVELAAGGHASTTAGTKWS